MSDPQPPEARPHTRPPKSHSRSLLDRLSALVRQAPEDKDDVRAILADACERGLLEDDVHTMIEGAIAFSDHSAGDVMVPRSRIDALDVNRPLAELLPIIIEAAHSRFPVYEDSRDNIIGLLLAKDLLRCMVDPSIELRALIRPAVFIPESKRLSVLLREFRIKRNHIAMVVDEHGDVAGLVTMEDVLEQIVGEIEDEYDEEAEQTIFPDGLYRWRVMATTDIARFNEAFNSDLEDDDYDTVGGWLADQLDHVPRRGDVVERNNLRIEVTRADPRRALWLSVQLRG